MNKKEQNHIDELFRKGLEDLDSTPSDHLWEKIAKDTPKATEIDEVFQKGLQDEEVQPSQRVWEAVEQELPLNLSFKRRLNQMVMVAVMVVIGMLLLLIWRTWNTTTTEPQDAKAESTKEYAMEEIITPLLIPPIEQKAQEKTAEKKSKSNKAKQTGHTMDKSLEEEMKVAELNLHADDGLEVDEAKMQEILAPISNPDLDSAIARVNGDSDMPQNEEEVIIPDDLVKPKK